MLLCSPPDVMVNRFAQSFLDHKPIAGASLIQMESGRQLQTDAPGHFQFCAKINSQVTLTLYAKDYHSVQTATTVVPASGLTSQYNQITFQVPSSLTYALLTSIITEERGIALNQNGCQLVTTVTQYHKTLKDDPQGQAGARLLITQNGKPLKTTQPFYFGIFTDGKTNPFTPNLTQTSADGGVLRFNLPPSQTPYTVTASARGLHFSQARFTCKAGSFINMALPDGPCVVP